MSFDPVTAAIRFGTGLSPLIAPPADAAAMLGALHGPDAMAAAFPIPRFSDLQPVLRQIDDLVAQRRRAADQTDKNALSKQVRQFRKAAREAAPTYLNAAVARGMFAEDGFRERLCFFWADHFTAKGKTGVLRYSTSPYVEEAIRPHLAGRFADLLRAAITHPFMLVYLDQNRSAGPSSELGRKKGRGLNENLAREVLELHTLGVGGVYGQADVRQLAELLSGLTVRWGQGLVFNPNQAEPGAETVLGVDYGAEVPKMDDIYAFLEDLSLHPDTARHIAHKLAVHFVSDTPDAALVDHIAAAFIATGGDLTASYGAMLDHAAAWTLPARKARQPFDFVVASLRALGVDERRMMSLKYKDTLRLIGDPMRAMGQDWENPFGPDGWPEEAGAWITPQGIAARIEWAMIVPERLRRTVEDPRAVVDEALGPRASRQLRFAVSAAESKWEGLGLILVSPEFQRR